MFGLKPHPDVEPNREAITPSVGVTIAPLAGGVLVFDAVTEAAHTINGLAAHVLDAAVRHGSLGCADLVADITNIVGGPGVDAGLVAARLDETLTALTDLGLLGRSTAPVEPPGTPTPVIAEPDPTWAIGRTHEYLDHRLVFCGPAPDLLAEVDSHLGGPDPQVDAPPTVHFGVVPKPGGRIDYFDTSHWDFIDLDQLCWQLPGAINDFMARSESIVVLHAGAVRTPNGAVVAVTGPIDAGKSTLIAALIGAGCDYIGDESTGIHPDTLHAWGYPKPLTLDATSQRVVGMDPADVAPSPVMHRRAKEIRHDTICAGGEVGPVDLVVEVSYQPEATYSATQLELGDAIRVLMTNTLNLVRVGQPGLEALARMAETVPVIRITHGDSLEAAHRITNTHHGHHVALSPGAPATPPTAA